MHKVTWRLLAPVKQRHVPFLHSTWMDKILLNPLFFPSLFWVQTFNCKVCSQIVCVSVCFGTFWHNEIQKVHLIGVLFT